MAIIGDGDSVLAFKAGGVDAFPVSHVEKARDLLKELSGKYNVIFVTDVIAKQIDDVIKKYILKAGYGVPTGIMQPKNL